MPPKQQPSAFSLQPFGGFRVAEYLGRWNILMDGPALAVFPEVIECDFAETHTAG